MGSRRNGKYWENLFFFGDDDGVPASVSILFLFLCCLYTSTWVGVDMINLLE